MRSWWVGLFLAVTASAVLWAEGENSPCAKLLPSTELKGWKEVKSSYLYGKGEGLTSIYDGGYQLYLKHGVQEAAQKLYQRGDAYVTVTTHTMKDAVSAQKFVHYWREAHRQHKPQALKLAGAGFWIQAEGATTLYWAKGRFFVTVMVSRDDRQAIDAGLLLLRAVAGKVR